MLEDRNVQISLPGGADYRIVGNGTGIAIQMARCGGKKKVPRYPPDKWCRERNDEESHKNVSDCCQGSAFLCRFGTRIHVYVQGGGGRARIGCGGGYVGASIGKVDYNINEEELHMYLDCVAWTNLVKMGQQSALCQASGWQCTE